MGLKQQIEQDLKVALLEGDKLKVSTLRSLKSAILYEEVARGERQHGLSDEGILAVLAKEAKKRQESADLYLKGGEEPRAEQELAEKAIIENYLPAKLSEDELVKVIDTVIESNDAAGPQAMGQVIGQVKQQVGAAADGATIARLVKERLAIK